MRLLAGAQRRVPWGVALTFNGCQPGLLDGLHELDARATFFLTVDELRAEPDVALRMRADGHGIGMCAASLAADDIETSVVALQLVLGQRSRLFRPSEAALDLRGAWTLRRARLDSWLWRTDLVADVRERDVVLVASADVAAAVAAARARDLDLVAL